MTQNDDVNPWDFFATQVGHQAQVIRRPLRALDEGPEADRAANLQTLLTAVHGLQRVTRPPELAALDATCLRLEHLLATISADQHRLASDTIAILRTAADGIEDVATRLRERRFPIGHWLADFLPAITAAARRPEPPPSRRGEGFLPEEVRSFIALFVHDAGISLNTAGLVIRMLDMSLKLSDEAFVANRADFEEDLKFLGTNFASIDNFLGLLYSLARFPWTAVPLSAEVITKLHERIEAVTSFHCGLTLAPELDSSGRCVYEEGLLSLTIFILRDLIMFASMSADYDVNIRYDTDGSSLLNVA